MNKKGQVTMEFMVSILALLIVFVFCLSIFVQRTDLVKDFDERLESKNMAFSLSKIINSVSLMDNNSRVCEHFFWVKANQKISFRGDILEVRYGDTYSYSKILANKVNWEIRDVNGLICFTKKNDSIFVEYGGE